MKEIGVIGGGSWGTALAILLNENGYQVTLWCHSEKSAQNLQKTRSLPEKLPGIQISEKIRITASMEETVSGKEILVVVVPSDCVRETAEKMKPFIHRGVKVVSASKGIEEGTLMTLTDIIGDTSYYVGGSGRGPSGH